MEEKPVVEKPIARPERPALYTDEEAQDILSRAMGLNAQSVSHESLARMATELGISPEELERAEADYLANSTQANELARAHAQRRAELQQQVSRFALRALYMFLFFGFIGFISGTAWVLVPAVLATLAWGAELGSDILDYRSGSNALSDGYADQRLSRRQRRLERRQRRLEK